MIVIYGTLRWQIISDKRRQKTVFYLLVMPGSKRFKTKELSNQIGSARLSFAGAEEMVQFLNITPGAVSITY